MQETVLDAMDLVQSLGKELSSGRLRLPSFPEAATRLRKALDDPDCSAAQLARIVGADAALAASVMRLANSAAYNRSGTAVTSLQVAISRLGHKNIRGAAMAMVARQLAVAAARPELRHILQRLWKRSVYVAAVAYSLARRLPAYLDNDTAMLAGLVHNIGQLYIVKRAAELGAMSSDPETVAELMAGWHTGVGRAIVEHWGFPEAIAVAVDEHEETGREYIGVADVTTAVMAAVLLVRMDAGEIEAVDWRQVPAFAKLGLSPGSCEAVLTESAGEIRSIVQALEG